MKTIPSWLVDKVLAPYREGFVYPKGETLLFCTVKNTIGGNVIYSGGPYLKKKSSVFNAPEASFAFFQIMYILTTCHMMLRDGYDPFVEKMPRFFKHYYDLQGRLVVRKLGLLFERPIFGTPSDLLPIEMALTNTGRSRQRFAKFMISGHLGNQAEFRSNMTIYLIDKDIHGVKQAF